MATTRLAGLLALLVPALMAPAAGGGDGPFQFGIERNGQSVGFFQTCRGLGSTNEVIEVREGGDPNLVRKVPGRLSAGNVTCTRGITASSELGAWRALVEQGKIADARSSASVILYDATLAPIAQWTLVNAWPSELLALGTAAAAVESVTLVSEGVQRVGP